MTHFVLSDEVCGWKRRTARVRLLQGRVVEVRLASLFPHGLCIILATSSSSSSLLNVCVCVCVQLKGFWLLANWSTLIEWHQMPAAPKMRLRVCTLHFLMNNTPAHARTHTAAHTHVCPRDSVIGCCGFPLVWVLDIKPSRNLLEASNPGSELRLY